MKVLIIIDGLGSGGAERSTEVMADHLDSKNIDFTILCLNQRDVGVQQRMEAAGYKIRFLKDKGFFSQTKEISDTIKSQKFDVVHSILFRSNLRTRFAKLLTSFTHLESLVNTTYSEERFADEKVNRVLLRIYKNLDAATSGWGVDHFHSITEAVKIHYIEEVGLKRNKITVIPRGRKPILDDYSDRPERTSDKINLINVGRHEFQKGQIFLLKAVKELKAKKLDFFLSIYGRDGTVTAELENYIKENYLADVVALTGYSSNIHQHLLESDIFVFPSLYEGLGGSLIEAQAAGLPIACNDILVFKEVVRENKNAELFDSHDIDSIVNALTKLIKNNDLRQKYGKESLKNYEDKFQESINNKKLLDLYKKLA